MADTTTAPTPRRGLAAAVASFFAARRAYAELERLETRTDADLARDGQTRETATSGVYDRYLAG